MVEATTAYLPLTIIGKRYQLQKLIGEGSMGRVYQATDLLTGQNVALKRAATSTAELQPGTTSDLTNFEVALVQEFKILASLRHPNILSVLDFGFDDDRHPYFTMRLLEDSKTIIEAGQGKPQEMQVDLVIQLLQALAYLHRRNILHRDLKPGNVRAADGQVKVLDFGLSMISTLSTTDAAESTAGTLAYMAPEIIKGESPSRGTDLYAVGMITYELLSGRYPYDLTNIGVLLNQILNVPIDDITSLGLNTDLEEMLERLLVKSRNIRFDDANKVIIVLSEATNRPYEEESAEIRESFLQAAEFVGRAPEMTLLSNSLEEVIDGQGSAWLVGGESGVGKTRLVEEVRTLALVRGTLVSRGQAVQSGRSPFLLWRDVIHWLLLLGDIDELQAGVLKPLVPGIEALLGRTVPDAPELEPADAQTRVFSIVTELISKQQEPITIILEDLQWASAESLALLSWVLRLVTDHPLFIIGNYRDDERAGLPEQLLEMQLLKLKRLSKNDTAALSESMLGASARDQALQELLWHETEGNPFFLVEVVRALAEEVGYLGEVGTMPLPTSVLTGGQEKLINRRLSRVPGEYLPLLQCAAVAGRRLDLNLLQAVEPSRNLDNWLEIGTNAAVLDIQDDRWQFAHDKLREGLLANLAKGERRRIHRLLASTIEEIYPDSADQAANLAYHWAMAGDVAREAHYAAIAGTQAMRSGANQEAARFLQRVLDLDQAGEIALPDVDRVRMMRQLGQAYLGLGLIAESQGYLRQMLALSGRPVPVSRGQLIASLLRQILTQVIHRLFPSRFVGRASAEKAAVLLEAARAYQQMAEIHFYASEKIYLLNAGLNTLNLSESAGPSPELARAYGNMSIIMGHVPLVRMAEAYARWSLETARQTEDLPALAWALVTGGTYANGRGQWERTHKNVEQSMDVCRRIGNKRQLGLNLAVLCLTYYFKGRFAKGAELSKEFYDIATEARNTHQQSLALLSHAQCALPLGRPEQTIELGQAASVYLAERELDVVPMTFRMHSLMAAAYWRLGEQVLARQELDAAMALADLVSSPNSAMTYAGLSHMPQSWMAIWESEGSASAELKEMTKRSCSILSGYARVFPSMLPRDRLCWGLFAWLSGHERKAQREWRAGLEAAEKLEMPFEQGLAHFEIGRHSDGAALELHLARAIELFDRLNTPHELARAQIAHDDRES